MRLLLDTHVFLWWVYDDPKLSQTARDVILDSANTKYVSAVTAWELAIKAGQGKLKLNQSVADFYIKYTNQNYFETIPLGLNHLFMVERLPSHHKDPFDRLLVVQAQAEKLKIVSADNALDAYEIERLW
ncbi:type II toxin-antitoxin system VapC family toxin [Methyloradius palustris]|uniref:Twitching motility protein PilT n=1 Tax=Methyloradius palustris TaxID=2778876 RepID=A0A8D5G250_9PROT|nr:type II toxin-antitoxin system VapC family toxin [Methyloradius palustris]BCM24668.1 twitching motility protein PilT [Methyloradius palustris]